MSTDLQLSRRPAADYLPTLDGWRAVAIALVLFHHGHASLAVALGPGVDRFAARVPDLGLLGVRIFFAISGFLICSRLIDERRLRGRLDLRGFYARRACRIVPPLALVLIVVLALKLAGALVLPTREWLAGAALVINYVRSPDDAWYLQHLWSLSVEEHFYLVFPCLLAIVGVARGLAASTALAVAIGLWRVALFHATATRASFDGAYFWGRTDVIADGLLWGCAAAFLYASPIVRARWATLARPAVWWTLAAILAASTLSLGRSRDWKFAMLIFELQTIAIPLLIVSTVLRPRDVAGRVLESRPLRAVGRVSYGLYLWQQLFLVKPADVVPALAPLQRFPANLATIAALAIASYFLLERPMIRLGHRLARPATAGRDDLDDAAATAAPAVPRAA